MEKVHYSPEKDPNVLYNIPTEPYPNPKVRIRYVISSTVPYKVRYEKDPKDPNVPYKVR